MNPVKLKDQDKIYEAIKDLQSFGVTKIIIACGEKGDWFCRKSDSIVLSSRVSSSRYDIMIYSSSKLRCDLEDSSIYNKWCDKCEYIIFDIIKDEEITKDFVKGLISQLEEKFKNEQERHDNR